ncbi:hypothetical protein N0V82_005578 [Gnomoniopsis sp. IMI 355080]|nr:hypothetical protein N0V82_005578 [Gnomoniopsis sp. IMI 355080]
MPRPGAVTRSITRAGEAGLLLSSEQAAANRITVHPVSATSHERTMNESPNSKLAASSNLMPSSIPSSALSVELLTQNRMTILQLEQVGILAPGVLTIELSGELRVDLSAELDMGTMMGLFPTDIPAQDANDQISSWLRDYLLKILNVHGYGPPAVCRAFYDHLNEGKGRVSINHSVRTAESLLSYATISLRYAIEEVDSFSSMQHTVKDTYDQEVWNVIKTIKRLVGYEGEAMPEDIRLLVEIAQMGTSMKEALNEPLQSHIVTPYTQLLEKLELVSKALRTQLDRIDQEAENAREAEGPRSTPDSGIYEC